MKSALCLFFSIGALVPALAKAHVGDDPALGKVLLDVFEWQPEEKGHFNWDAHAWYGRDLQKLWLKTEGERTDDGTEAVTSQLLYGRALAPYWDFQVGWRHDYTPAENKNWLAFGLHGLMPYFFETELNGFIDGDGVLGVSLETEREIMLTQKLVLAPELEIVAFSTDEPEMGHGSGLATVEAALRLRYEIRREIAPYIGVTWERAYGETADLVKLHGEEIENTEWVVGIHAWF